MKVLVTGGAGFIGSHLVEKLLSNGHYVICVDNFCDFYNPAIKEQNINKALQSDHYKLYRSDIRDINKMDEIFQTEKPEVIVHLAAMAGVRPSIENPLLYQSVNNEGTMNLLEMSKKHHIKNFVFASSSSVYGNNEKVPFSESDNVDFPISPYAATKKAGELMCFNYHHLYGMSIACLRFFTVYGPRQRPDLAIHKFTQLILDEKPIQVFGDGSTQRDYTYIEDILDGITKAIQFVQSGCHYEIFNLGESQTVSLKQMIETIEKVLGKEAKKIPMPMQPGDVNRTFADTTKSRKLLGYNPVTHFEDGIKKFIDWKTGVTP